MRVVRRSSSTPSSCSEPAHLVRERGLGDVELLGGAREVAVTGDGFEVRELAELHGVDSAYIKINLFAYLC